MPTNINDPKNQQSFIVSLFYSVFFFVRSALASKRTKATILYKKVTFRELLTGILLVIPSAATTMLTYYGVSIPLSEQGGGIVVKGQALAFAITVGTFSWLSWFYLFGLIYRLRGKRLGTSLIAGTFSVLAIAAIDAPFNMLALGGGSAVQMTMVDTSDYYEVRKDAVFVKAAMAQRLLPAVVPQAVRFRTLESDEIEYGTFSGRPGPGKVSAGFGQIAGLLETLAKELQTGLGEAATMQDQIAVIFSKMKRQTYVTGHIRSRVTEVSIIADQLDDLLVQLRQYDYAISIDATLSSLNAIFPAPIKSSSNFEKTQNSELVVIAEMAKPVAMVLREALKELKGVSQPALARVRPQNAMTAIRTKWVELLSHWLAALFVDLAPGALLITLIASFKEVEVLESEARDQLKNSKPKSKEQE